MSDGREGRVLGGLSFAVVVASGVYAFWPVPAAPPPLPAQASCAGVVHGGDNRPYSWLVPGGQVLAASAANARHLVDTTLAPLSRVYLVEKRGRRVRVHLRIAGSDVCGWVDADDLVGVAGADLSTLADGPQPIPANPYSLSPPIGAAMRIETAADTSRLKLHAEPAGPLTRALPVRADRALAFHVFRFTDANPSPGNVRRRWYLVGVREDRRARVVGWVSDEQVATMQVRDRTFALEPASAAALAMIAGTVCSHDGRRGPMTPVWRDIGAFVGEDIRRRADGPGHLLTAVFGVPRDAVPAALFDTWVGTETSMRHLPSDRQATLTAQACRTADALAALKPVAREDAEDVPLVRVPLDLLR